VDRFAVAQLVTRRSNCLRNGTPVSSFKILGASVVAVFFFLLPIVQLLFNGLLYSMEKLLRASPLEIIARIGLIWVAALALGFALPGLVAIRFGVFHADSGKTQPSMSQ
jgi:hypothetical protein